MLSAGAVRADTGCRGSHVRGWETIDYVSQSNGRTPVRDVKAALRVALMVDSQRCIRMWAAMPGPPGGAVNLGRYGGRWIPAGGSLSALHPSHGVMKHGPMFRCRAETSTTGPVPAVSMEIAYIRRRVPRRIDSGGRLCVNIKPARAFGPLEPGRFSRQALLPCWPAGRKRPIKGGAGSAPSNKYPALVSRRRRSRRPLRA